MKKERTRRMKMPLACVEAHPGWSNASISFKQFTGTEWKEFVLVLESPWDLRYVRQELDKIEAGWRESLDRAKP